MNFNSICFSFFVLTVVQQIEVSESQCTNVALQAACFTAGGYYVNGHCFWISTNQYTDIDSAIQDCVSGVSIFSTLSTLVTGRIANFFTNDTFQQVVTNLPIQNVFYRIGIMSCLYTTNNLNQSDYVVINDSTHAPVAPWMWSIKFPAKKGNIPMCIEVDGGHPQTQVDSDNCYKGKTIGQICEAICTGTTDLCWDCNPTGVVPGMDSLICSVDQTTSEPVTSTVHQTTTTVPTTTSQISSVSITSITSSATTTGRTSLATTTTGNVSISTTTRGKTPLATTSTTTAKTSLSTSLSPTIFPSSSESMSTVASLTTHFGQTTYQQGNMQTSAKIVVSQTTTTTPRNIFSNSPIPCQVGIWGSYSACSASCGISATKIRNRNIAAALTNATCPNSSEIVNCKLAECNPMSPTAQIVSNVLQEFGCTWLIGICTVCFMISLLLRSWDVSRMIHASQEISLIVAHLLISFGRNETENLVLCTWIAIVIQYLFIVMFSFICLEALHVYALVSTVTAGSSYLTRPMTMIIGWGAPSTIVAITAITSYKHYVSTFSCWLNFGHKISFCSMVPIGLLCCGSVVLVEAAGQRANRDLNIGNSAHILSARINQRSLLILVPLQVASWFVGQSAVYYQNIAMFSTVFALNLSLGTCIGFFHVLANTEGRAFLVKLWAKIKSKPSNKVNATR